MHNELIVLKELISFLRFIFLMYLRSRFNGERRRDRARLGAASELPMWVLGVQVVGHFSAAFPGT